MQVVLGFPAHRLLGLSCSLCHPFVRCIWEVSSNWNSLILCTGSDAHSGRICAYFCGASFNKSEEEVSTYICGQSNKHFLFPVFWCGTTIIQDYPRLSKIIQDHPRSSKLLQDLVFRCGRRRGVIGGCGNCQRSLLSSLIQVPSTFWHLFMWTITLIMINTDQPLNNKKIVLLGS